MRFAFLGKMTAEELKMLLPRAFIADLVIYLLTLPFYGLSAEVPLGLLLGTAAMTANLILLGYSVDRAVEYKTEKAAKRYMFSFYLIRFAVMGAALTAGIKLRAVNLAAVCIPLFYPKAIYTIRGIINNKSSGKGG